MNCFKIFLHIFILALAGCGNDSNKKLSGKEASAEELSLDIPATAKVFARLTLITLQTENVIKATEFDEKLAAVNSALDQYWDKEKSQWLEEFKNKCTGAERNILVDLNSCIREARTLKGYDKCSEEYSVEGNCGVVSKSLLDNFTNVAAIALGIPRGAGK
jgi:hypothetical protein